MLEWLHFQLGFLHLHGLGTNPAACEWWHACTGGAGQEEVDVAESAYVEDAAEETLAQHPAPARFQMQREAAAGPGPRASDDACPAEGESGQCPVKTAGVVADAVWENEHVVHVWVTGAVLSGEHAPDGTCTAPPPRQRGWACTPTITLPSGMGLSFPISMHG